MDDMEKLYSSIKNEKIRETLKNFANAVAEYQQKEVYQLDDVRWSLEKLINEIQNKKVYAITCGDYDDYRIEGVASTPYIAKRFMDQFLDQKQSDSFNDLKEIIIDNLYKIPEGKFPYFIRINKDTFESIEVKKLPLTIMNCVYMVNKIYKDNHEDFMIYVLAIDADEANKVAFEKLNKYLAEDFI